MLLFLTGLFQISGNGVTVPVPNDKCGVINYRLITISPVISKLFESVAAILGGPGGQRTPYFPEWGVTL